MIFFDDLGTTFVNGLNKKIDAELTTPQPINDDRTYNATPGGGVIPAGYTLPASSLAASLPSIDGRTVAVYGGGLAVVLVLLKVMKII